MAECGVGEIGWAGGPTRESSEFGGKLQKPLRPGQGCVPCLLGSRELRQTPHPWERGRGLRAGDGISVKRRATGSQVVNEQYLLCLCYGHVRGQKGTEQAMSALTHLGRCRETDNRSTNGNTLSGGHGPCGD